MGLSGEESPESDDTNFRKGGRIDHKREKLDSPVKPENDKQIKLYRHTNDRISNAKKGLCSN